MQFLSYTGALLDALLVLAALSIVVYTVKTGISPMPSSRKATCAILALIPVETSGTIIELGSGWGTLVFPLAKAFPSCAIVGYELSPVPWLFSRVAAVLFPRYNLTIHRRDFLKLSLAQASVVVFYLHPGALRKLGPKLEKELHPGALVVCNTFPIPSWAPRESYDLGGGTSRKIFVYEV